MGRRKKGTNKVEDIKDALLEVAPRPSRDDPAPAPVASGWSLGPGRSKKSRAKARKRARQQGLPPPPHALQRDDPNELARAEAVLWPSLTLMQRRRGSKLRLQARTDPLTKQTEYIYTVQKSHKRSKNVLWHGTTADGLTGILEAGFQAGSHGLLGPGVYVGNRNKAVNYARKFVGRYYVLLKVAVNLGEVIDINTWKERPDTPHDTVYCPAGENTYAWGGSIRFEEWCLRDPKRVTVLAVHLVTR